MSARSGVVALTLVLVASEPRPRSAAGVPALPGAPSSGSIQALAADLPSDVPRARQTVMKAVVVSRLEKKPAERSLTSLLRTLKVALRVFRQFRISWPAQRATGSGRLAKPRARTVYVNSTTLRALVFAAGRDSGRVPLRTRAKK